MTIMIIMMRIMIKKMVMKKSKRLQG